MKADYDIRKLEKTTNFSDAQVVMGILDLLPMDCNQPVVRKAVLCIMHIVNEDEVWDQLDDQQNLQIDLRQSLVSLKNILIAIRGLILSG